MSTWKKPFHLYCLFSWRTVNFDLERNNYLIFEGKDKSELHCVTRAFSARLVFTTLGRVIEIPIRPQFPSSVPRPFSSTHTRPFSLLSQRDDAHFFALASSFALLESTSSVISGVFEKGSISYMSQLMWNSLIRTTSVLLP